MTSEVFTAMQQHERQHCARCERVTSHWATYASEGGKACVIRTCLVCGNEYAEMAGARIPVIVQPEQAE